MTETAIADTDSLPELPSVWPGFVLAGSFFVTELGEQIIDPSDDPQATTPILLLIIVAANLYWLFNIYRVHRVLATATKGAYPIRPIKAVGFHFIPFVNLYWIVHWPNAIADYVNQKLGASRMGKIWPGLCLILGLGLTHLFDGALGLIVMFSALLYIRRKLSAALPE